MSGKTRKARRAAGAPPTFSTLVVEARRHSPAWRLHGPYDADNPLCTLLILGCRGADTCTHRDIVTLAADPDTDEATLTAIAAGRGLPDISDTRWHQALATLLQRDTLSPTLRRHAAHGCARAACALTATMTVPLSDGRWRANSVETAWLALLTREDLTKADLLAALTEAPPTADIVTEILRSHALTPLAECTLAWAVHTSKTSTDASRNAIEHGGHPLAAVAYALTHVPANPPWTPKLLLHRSRALLHSTKAAPDAVAALVTGIAPGWTSDASELIRLAPTILAPAGRT